MDSYDSPRKSSETLFPPASEEQLAPFLGYHARASKNRSRFGCGALIPLLWLLILSNVGWGYYEFIRPTRGKGDVNNDSDIVYKSLHWNTQYSDDNKTKTNDLWKGLFPLGQGLVKMSNQDAKAKHLPASISYNGSSTESVYFVAAYHQIHCLSVIRATLYHYAEGVDQTVPFQHTLHCLDSLRQEVMCHSDSTLLYTDDGKVFGDGQLRQCRDWESLRAWTVSNRV